MSWYNMEGASPEFFIWSKMQYTRDLSSLQFSADGNEYASACHRVGELLAQNGFREESLPVGICPEVLAMGEKQFVDKGFIEAERGRHLYLNEPCNLAISVGGDSFLSIRSLLSGRAVTECFNNASGAEELLDASLDFAFSDNFGYLVGDPADCGSGAEISTALFLPTMSDPKRRAEIMPECACRGISISPFFMDKNETGSIFIISMRLPTRRDELSSVMEFDSFCQRLIQSACISMKEMTDEHKKQLVDKAWRAFGILSYANRLGEAELLSLISDLRRALAFTDGTDPLPPVSYCTLNYLLAEGMNASVIANLSSCTTETECDEARAAMTARTLSKEPIDNKN